MAYLFANFFQSLVANVFAVRHTDPHRHLIPHRNPDSDGHPDAQRQRHIHTHVYRYPNPRPDARFCDEIIAKFVLCDEFDSWYQVRLEDVTQ